MPLSLSIIVPIYNKEDYLVNCLESLIAQKDIDYEVLLIDDGSTDDSGPIADRYASLYSHIKVIHQENKGVSASRNAGLAMAKGLYILFIDADDYITINCLSQLYKQCTYHMLDILIIEKYESYIPINQMMSGKEFLTDRLLAKNVISIVINKFYRKEFLVLNQLLFPEGLVHEDIYFHVVSMLSAEKVMCTDYDFYHLVKSPDSITRRSDRTINGKDFISICYLLEKEIKKVQDRKLKKLLNDYIANIMLYGIDFGNIYDKEYNHLYSKSFLIGKSYFLDTKIKTGLFLINKKLYKLGKKVFNRFQRIN